MNGYELSRQWFDWCASHSGEYTASHTGFMFWVIELNNQLGWKERFGLPSMATMEILNIRSYKTYKSIFNDLVNWGFIRLHQKATNNHTANIIELVKFTTSTTISTTISTTNLVPTQLPSDCSLSVDIDKPINNKPINNKKEDIIKKTETVLTPSSDKIDFKKLIETYHRLCPTMPKVREFTEARKKAVKARLKEFGKPKIKEVLEKAGSSKFLNGENDRNFTASFDWIFAPKNFVKILEGNYDNKIFIQNKALTKKKEDDPFKNCGEVDLVLAKQLAELAEKKRIKVEA